MKNFKYILLFLGILFILPNIIKAETSNPSSYQKPSITVIYPNGGEVFDAGQKISIKWKSVGVPSDANITVSLEGKQNEERIHSTSLSRGEIANDGEATLSLVNFVDPEFSNTTWGAGKHYKIYVSTDYLNIKDYSDDFFTINASLPTKQTDSNEDKENKNNSIQQKKAETLIPEKKVSQNIVKESKNNSSIEKVSVKVEKEKTPINASNTLITTETKKPNLWQRVFRFFFGQ